VVKLIAALLLVARVALADPSAQLHDANAAATAGDWGKVSALVDPLITASLSPAELAEANRLYGLAAFFQGRQPEAEAHFLAYLRIDLDGNLDPQLYPPEVITFFIEVRTKYAAELRARRPKKKRYMALNLVPAAGQFQNGEPGKGIVIGTLFGAFAIANVTSYLVLRSWCTHVNGDAGSSVTCDGTAHHQDAAKTLSNVNIATGIGLIVTYVVGVYDGVKGYRRKEHEVQPYASLVDGTNVVGVVGRF
jgi:hypothetical protein